MIIGFNWGAAQNEKYFKQKDIPKISFKEAYKDLGSMKRSYNLLKDVFPCNEIENSVQSNFCFFRSKKENQITYKDLELSSPLFKRFLELVCPKRIVGFSSKLQEYFLNKKELLKNVEEKSIQSNKRCIKVSKGEFQVNKSCAIPFFFLPHPNYPITKSARKEALVFLNKSINFNRIVVISPLS